MKKFLEEFKSFAMRGNVVDMAVGVVIGGAFGKITTSLVNDIIMPAVSMLTGGVNFSDWKWVLKEGVMEQAPDGTWVETVAPVTINYGALISTVIDFVILAFAVFCMVKAINNLHERARKHKEEAEASEASAPSAPPEPSAEEKLLTEIRDLLKEK